MERRDKINYYLDIAQAASGRATCLRRKYGAILVNHDEIIATGFNGAPRGRENCTDRGFCLRDQLGIPSGERYEMCRAVHAEANCIISAPRATMIGGTLYLACVNPKDGGIMDSEPCSMCKRLIINAGIVKTIIREADGGYKAIMTEKWIENDESLHDHKGY